MRPSEAQCLFIISDLTCLMFFSVLSSVNIAESHSHPSAMFASLRGGLCDAYYVVNIDINELIILDSYQHIIYY